MRTLLYIVICQATGLLSGWASSQAIRDWYPALKKPWFNPPNWIFGPVWTLLYLLMGIAGSRVSESSVCTRLFFLQLTLNGLWSILFFTLRRPIWAFVDIVLLWASIVACIHAFARVDVLAARLMWPYLLWVSFAALLNLEICRLNASSLGQPTL